MVRTSGRVGPVMIGYVMGMARPVWTGSISFGLVNVPVKAYTAVRDHDVHFHQLEKGTGSRIRNRKVAEKTGKEVDTDDIEMGFEIRKGRYVTFDKKELDELRPASTRMIEVTDFVALEEIDPIYYERTYWLGARRRAGEEGLRAAAGRDGGERAGRDRHGRDAQQAVPHRRPPARRRAGHVDDAVRRRGRATGRYRRAPEPAHQARRQGADDGDPARRVAGRRLGARAATRTPTSTSCASASRRKRHGQGDRREATNRSPTARCST